MCTILLAWKAHPDAPIMLAANRDELIARPSAPPAVLRTAPLIVGGLDLVAGGTWLAVGADGAICAVTNRHPGTGPPRPPDPSRRSRGEIPLALLGEDDRSSIPDRLAELGDGRYNPVNVLWVSADRALVAHIDESGPARVVDLEPGPHVLTTGDVDDAQRPKVAMLRAGLDRALAPQGSPDETTTRLRTLLADHASASDSPVDAACIHGDVYGTVSASTVVVTGGVVAYEHAPGRPCVTPFVPVPVSSV